MCTEDVHTKLSTLWPFILLNTDVLRTPPTRDAWLLGNHRDWLAQWYGDTPQIDAVWRRCALRPDCDGAVVYAVAVSVCPALTFFAALMTTVTVIPPAPIDLSVAYRLVLQRMEIVAVAWWWMPRSETLGVAPALGD